MEGRSHLLIGLTAGVVVDPRHASAVAAAHFAREQVLRAPLALDVAALGGVELLLGDERVVDAGTPLLGVGRLAEVDAVLEDVVDGRVANAVNTRREQPH